MPPSVPRHTILQGLAAGLVICAVMICVGHYDAPAYPGDSMRTLILLPAALRQAPAVGLSPFSLEHRARHPTVAHATATLDWAVQSGSGQHPMGASGQSQVTHPELTSRQSARIVNNVMVCTGQGCVVGPNL